MSHPTTPPRAVTHVVAGHPVSHSRSPWIHARFAEITGQGLRYDRLDVTPGQLGQALQRFQTEGGQGCNVTVPCKFEAYELAVRRSERAELAQAVNTLRFDQEGWWGDNTDGVGLVRDLTVNAGWPLAGRHLLVLGAGGAAAGILAPLLQARPSRIDVVNRTAAKALELAARHAPLAERSGVVLKAHGLDESAHLPPPDVIINATAASLSGDARPLPACLLRPGQHVVDLMYGPGAEGFLSWAAGHGAITRDGLGMLVEQAAEAFHAWTGTMPPGAQVLDELRAHLAGQAPH